MDEFNYYKTELEKINTESEYPAQMKIKSESGETKWLSLNQESASEIVQFLTDKYLTK